MHNNNNKSSKREYSATGLEVSRTGPLPVNKGLQSEKGKRKRRRKSKTDHNQFGERERGKSVTEAVASRPSGLSLVGVG